MNLANVVCCTGRACLPNMVNVRPLPLARTYMTLAPPLSAPELLCVGGFDPEATQLLCCAHLAICIRKSYGVLWQQVCAVTHMYFAELEVRQHQSQETLYIG